jgi:hypothetical protein
MGAIHEADSILMSYLGFSLHWEWQWGSCSWRQKEGCAMNTNYSNLHSVLNDFEFGYHWDFLIVDISFGISYVDTVRENADSG